MKCIFYGTVAMTENNNMNQIIKKIIISYESNMGNIHFSDTLIALYLQKSNYVIPTEGNEPIPSLKYKRHNIKKKAKNHFFKIKTHFLIKSIAFNSTLWPLIKHKITFYCKKKVMFLCCRKKKLSM